MNTVAAPRIGRVLGATAILLAAAWLVVVPRGAHATLYKWVDEKGVVHYTDQVPPDAVNKGNVQLNQQGIAIKKVDPATTLDQRKAVELEAQHKQEIARQQAEAARRDRALLDSYTSEADIDLAKTRAVKTIQQALDSAQAYSTQLTKRKAALTERKASVPAGKPVPADIERELAAIDVELGRQASLITQKQTQLKEASARYDLDKARWEALKGGAEPVSAPAAAGVATAAPAPGTVKK